MKLVLAEKPSVAQSIAKVLEANNRCDGYLEGNGCRTRGGIDFPSGISSVLLQKAI